MTIASEILKYNKSVTSVDLSRNDLNQGGQAISEWIVGQLEFMLFWRIFREWQAFAG
jgi:hypothetical protein